MTRSTLLGGLTPRLFLKRHWQKSPYLIRDAFPGFLPPISAHQLAGLACKENVESRLVIKTRRKPYWQVKSGPFTQADFRALPKTHWTLLVQDMDKHVPVLAALLDHFRFIPNWRIDDLMISYAADGGSVGPHMDAYDVFLLQAQGTRRWEISTRPHREADIPGLELRQVRAFTAQQDWLLQPGDMLYLPPGVAHHGVAVGACMTFSIGFRAPTDAEMLADLSGLLLERAGREARYSDPDLVPADADPGRIPLPARRAIRQRLRSALQLDDVALDEWFGRFITEPKPWIDPQPLRRPLTAAALNRKLKTAGSLERDAAAILAWFPAGRNGIKLFVNGCCHPLPARLAPLARLLCRQHRYPRKRLVQHLRYAQAPRLLVDLYNRGVLYFP